jgi:hypothetical protein
VTPNLGTPTAITLTNGTGLPISGITGLGTGVGTALGNNTNTNGGPLTGSTNSVATGAVVVGSGSGSAPTGIADVASGALFASGGAGSNPSYCTACLISGSLALGNTGNTIQSGVLLQTSKQSGVASHAPLLAGTSLQIIGANSDGTGGTINAIELDTFANGQTSGNYANALNGVAVGGTLASPSATPNGAFVWNLNAGGYDGTSYQFHQAQVSMVTTALWSHNTTYETQVQISATPPNSTSMGVEAIFQNGVLIGASGTQPGIGKLAITSMANSATTSAVCYNTSSGVLTYDGTIGTCNTSDERLKIFDRPIEGALDRLVALSRDNHFGYFHANERGKAQFGVAEHIGIGAQTLARYFPEITAVGEDGLMSAAYDKLTVPIIQALAELKAHNDNLRAEMTELKKVVNR